MLWVRGWGTWANPGQAEWGLTSRLVSELGPDGNVHLEHGL